MILDRLALQEKLKKGEDSERLDRTCITVRAGDDASDSRRAGKGGGIGCRGCAHGPTESSSTVEFVRVSVERWIRRDVLAYEPGWDRLADDFPGYSLPQVLIAFKHVTGGGLGGEPCLLTEFRFKL